MKEQSIKKNIFLSTLYQVLTVILPFITAPYISRVIGDYGIGVYSFTYSVQTYFGLIAALGTASYGTREIARVRHEPLKRSVLFWEIELLSIGTTMLVIILWAVFVAFNQNYRSIYIVLSLNILACAFDISWFYSGLEQFKYMVIQNSIFKVLGVILLFVFVNKQEDLFIYVLIVTSCSFLGTCSMWLYLKKFLVKVDIELLNIKRHFKETLIYFIPTIATSIYTVLDKTLIGLITKDAYQNGYYEQTTKIINMVKSLTFSAVNAVLGSRVSFLFSEKKYSEIKKRINDSLNYILLLGIGSCFGIISVASHFVPVFFGEGYDPVINLLKLMSPIVVIIGISNCLGSQYYTPGGYRKQSAGYICVGSAVNLICNIILIPLIGVDGAVAGSIIAEAIITVLYIKNCCGFMTVSQIFNLSIKKIISGGVMYAIVSVVSSQLEYSVFSLFFELFLGGAVYLLSLVIIKDDSIGMIKQLIKKVRNDE